MRLLLLLPALFLSSLVGYFHLLDTQITKLATPAPLVSFLHLGDNVWLPKIPSNQDTTDTDSTAPTISAQAALFIETNSGQVLYQKNPHQRLPIASLTKIMTIIVALENKRFTDTYTVSKFDAAAVPDHMELIPGEKLTLEELLEGVFTVSANDAAETIAEGSVDSRADFIKLMNDEAKQLGMTDSLFINPTGLEEDAPGGGSKPQYSSAYDVALMSRFAITHWPHLVDISDKPFIYLPATSTHQDYTLNSGINLLTTYPGVVGFKTGYTPDAGLTLVTLCRQNGKEVLGVILGSDDRRGEARELLDYSFNKLRS